MAVKRTINILGATGSIGKNTLDLVQAHPDRFQVGVLTAYSNVKELARLVIKHNATHAVIADESKYKELKKQLDGVSVEVMTGADALNEAASIDADITMAAIVGTAGLKPILNAIRQGKTVAFASKECLVAAGTLMMDEVVRCDTTLLPVDSEHNAIFQVFENRNKEHIKRLILTASGGPFRLWSKEQMDSATPEQAIAHPTWSMGAKISVDSATLMNKALEVIEAVYLFDMPEDKVDVIVHPQSLIHSMVEYVDGSILSQMGPSDMRTPIASCLAWPERMQTSGPMLDLSKLSELQFEIPDLDRFPALKIVRDVLKTENRVAPIIFNAANEIAVDAFLNKKIPFGDIMLTIQNAIENIPQEYNIDSLQDVIDCDQDVRARTQENLEITNDKYRKKMNA